MKTIAILGAGGRLGRVVAKSFLDNGYQVIAVTRSGKIPEELAGAKARAADAMDRDALICATAGADIIFNGLNPLYTDWKDKCMVMAQNVIAAARQNGAIHLFPGNVYTFGSPLPAELGEAAPFSPSTRKGAIRAQMEACFRDASREHGVQTIILRAGDFFGGKGTGSWFDLVVAKNVLKGVTGWPGPGNLAHAWAYLPDLAEAFVALAGKSGELGKFEIFHFPGHSITGEDMAAAIGRATGKPQKLRGLPWWAFRAGGLVVPMWREIAEMSYLWSEPHRIVSGRLEAAIGTVAHTSLDRAVARALTELGIVGPADGDAAISREGTQGRPVAA